MGANPVNVGLMPRKEGECFSLPSETRKMRDALALFEEKQTAHFTSSWDVWVDCEDDIRCIFSTDYPDYYLYTRIECDADISYHCFKNGRDIGADAARYSQLLSRGRIQLFSGDRALLNQSTIQELLKNSDITHLNLGEHSVAFQRLCLWRLFRSDQDYLAANLLYVGDSRDPEYSKQNILIQGTKPIVKNTLKARCLSDQEIQEIVVGFEHAFSQEKYQKELAELSHAEEIDTLYQKVLNFVKNAQLQGKAILYVPTSTKLDLDTLKNM